MPLGLTWRAKPLTDDEIFETLRLALELGCNYWNAGDFYGPPDNNSLTVLKKYYEKYPEDVNRVLLNVKGCSRLPDFKIDASPEGVHKSIEADRAMLGDKGFIDQFESARKDPEVEIEVSMRAMAAFVRNGKIGGVALSEVSAETIRKAAAVTKIEAVEIELSLWATEPLTNGVVEACAELDIPIVAYGEHFSYIPALTPPFLSSPHCHFNMSNTKCPAPLGRGALTGAIKSLDDIPEGDFRRTLPRFQPENWHLNLKLIDAIAALAAKKNCTAAQIAINWVVALNRRPGMPRIIPIPGASSPERLRENATVVDLAEEDMAEIERILASFPVAGDRYHKHGMALLDTSS